jgi:nucleotide-binding universal stress UspA family protein
MKPFKKILVPVDFSACSGEAVHAAAELAQRYDAELAIVHVFEPIMYTTPDGNPFLVPGQVEGLLADYAKALERAKGEAQAAGAKRVRAEELQGFAAPEIVAYATRGGCDLIVIGTHGRTGFKHALLGSVAEKVVRTAPCPVLTIRSSQQPAAAQ